MGVPSDIAWLGIGLIAFFGVLQILRCLAITVRNETMIHDLRVGVAKIQVERFHTEMLRHGMVPNTVGRAERTDAEPADADAVGEEPIEAGAADEPIEVSPVDEAPTGSAEDEDLPARRAA